MAQNDFDWIDDAFNDKKTAEDMERAQGPKLAGVLLLVVVIFAVILIGYAVVGIVGNIGAA